MTATGTSPTRDIGTSTEPKARRRHGERPARPSADPAAALDAAVGSALTRHGVRYTASRQALVAALRDARQPLTIPQLVDAASTLPQSSVYRNLAIFAEAGVVHRMPGTDDFARYELAEGLMGHHHHLVCSSCGTVEDIVLPDAVERELERVLRSVATQRGFSLTSHRLDVLGECTKCEERPA
jgi:Fur family ferric uptake transcriptional regulator